jgi:hypothetical protein
MNEILFAHLRAKNLMLIACDSRDFILHSQSHVFGVSFYIKQSTMRSCHLLADLLASR